MIFEARAPFRHRFPSFRDVIVMLIFRHSSSEKDEDGEDGGDHLSIFGQCRRDDAIFIKKRRVKSWAKNGVISLRG